MYATYTLNGNGIVCNLQLFWSKLQQQWKRVMRKKNDHATSNVDRRLIISSFLGCLMPSSVIRPPLMCLSLKLPQCATTCTQLYFPFWFYSFLFMCLCRALTLKQCVCNEVFCNRCLTLFILLLPFEASFAFSFFPLFTLNYCSLPSFHVFDVLFYFISFFILFRCHAMDGCAERIFHVFHVVGLIRGELNKRRKSSGKNNKTRKRKEKFRKGCRRRQGDRSGDGEIEKERIIIT